MLTQEIRNKVQRLWNMFWSRGITNPITAIEQISYLLFIRRLEEVDEYDNVTNVKKKSIFKGHEMCLWSRFSTLPPSDMLECYQNEVFPFIKTLNGEDEPFAQYMSDAVNEISQPNLLFDSVNIINSIYSDIERDKEQGQHFQDVQGDIYEYLINEIATSGKNGQFRTPRHIIQFICDLISPDVNDTICDPACGTGGFLLGALQSLLTKHTPANKRTSNPQPIGFSGILLAKRQNSFYCTYFLHNRNVADTKSPYPIKRLEVIRWFNQKSMVFNQSLS